MTETDLDYPAVFDALPSPCFVVGTDLRFVAVNRAFETVSGRSRRELLGLRLFEAFPAGPESGDDGAERLEESLLRCIGSGRPDVLPLQRYDIPDGTGGFRPRTWSAANIPVTDGDGGVRWVLHRTEDITDVVAAAPEAWTPADGDAPPGGDVHPEGTGSLAALLGQVLLRTQDLAVARREAELAASMAETLQRSLLTEPPEPDHLHVVVRYLPALDYARVGGDWFDSFVTPDGATTLVIGDVSGHDQRAVAEMGQLRNLVRGIAWRGDDPPAVTLTELDGALRALGSPALATAVLARIEQTPDDAAAHRRVLRWCNAGHLPPLLLQPDGAARLLEQPPELMLGVQPGSRRSDHTEPLPDGATVLLYTDGLVERRGEALTVGLERLRGLARDLAPLPLDDLCDRLLGELAEDRDDDVALAAVRLHAEDRPRPAEAGPRHVP